MNIFRQLFSSNVLLDCVLIVLCLSFSSWLMWSTFYVQDDSIVMGSKLYSDFAVHLPLIRSFSFGNNLPAEYPFFAGQPIRYHYLFYLLVGWLEMVGLRIDWALNTISVLGMTVFLYMVYKITTLFYRSTWGGVLAVCLVLLNGSLSFLRVIRVFFDKSSIWQSLSSIANATEFASFGPWDDSLVSAFWNWNIFTNQRHLPFSFGLLFVLLYPLFRHTVRKTSDAVWWVSGLVLIGYSVFPILHQAGCVALLVFTIGWLLWYWKLIEAQYRFSYILAVCYSLFFWYQFSAGAGSQSVAFELGFLATTDELKTILWYWLHNLGLYLLLLPVLLIRARKKIGIFLVLAFALFAAANVFRLSTDMINNHKFIHIFWIVLQVAAAGFLVELWNKKWLFTPLVVIAVVVMTLSGVIDIFPIINDRSAHIQTIASSPTQQWIAAHTPTRAQFLSTSYMYNPASLVGRKLYLDYGYHAWSMGYDDSAKRAVLPQFFAADISHSEWCGLARTENIQYLIFSPFDDFQGTISVADSMIVQQPVEYEGADGYKVLNVQNYCAE